jgi:hypothetical protein
MRKVRGFGPSGETGYLAENFSVFLRPSKQAEEEYLKLEHDGIFPLLSQRDINPLFHIILNLN